MAGSSGDAQFLRLREVNATVQLVAAGMMAEMRSALQSRGAPLDVNLCAFCSGNAPSAWPSGLAAEVKGLVHAIVPSNTPYVVDKIDRFATVLAVVQGNNKALAVAVVRGVEGHGMLSHWPEVAGLGLGREIRFDFMDGVAGIDITALKVADDVEGVGYGTLLVDICAAAADAVASALGFKKSLLFLRALPESYVDTAQGAKLVEDWYAGRGVGLQKGLDTTMQFALLLQELQQKKAARKLGGDDAQASDMKLSLDIHIGGRATPRAIRTARKSSRGRGRKRRLRRWSRRSSRRTR